VIKYEWMNLSDSDRRGVIILLKSHGYHMFVDKNGSDCIACIKG